MRKILVVARREYLATVVTRGFILSLVMVPILVVLGIIIPKFVAERTETDDKRIAVLDGTGILFPSLQREAEDHNAHDIIDPRTGKPNAPHYLLEAGPTGPVTEEIRLQLSDRVRAEELFAFVEIPPDIMQTDARVRPRVPFHAQKVMGNAERRWFERALNRSIEAHRLRGAGINPQVVEDARSSLRLEAMTLYKMARDGRIEHAQGAEKALTTFVPMGVMMLMFMAVMMSQYMLQSTLEEKQQRIAEVLLGSLSPFQLMAGKLLASVAVSLTMVCVYMIAGVCVAQYYGTIQHLPFGMVGWFFAYQILAVLLYGSIFGAVGAACSDLKDAQGLLMPVMMVLIFPMFVWFAVLNEPTGNLAVGMSLFPTMTPMFMPFRMALVPDLPMWQPIAGIVVVLITSIACAFAAGRVFRIGILSQGKPPKLSELLRWVVSG